MSGPIDGFTPGPWLAYHIFYTANSRPVITECVQPLVARLRADGLLHRYFFINYWLEGPHVRLRLQPTSAEQAPEVARLAEAAIAAFLARRPALYNVKSEFFVDMYNTLFDLEFEPEQRAQYVGEDGRMRQRDNNTFSPERYEPEFGKYGGPAGVELAEWHFERSSDLVVSADSSMNVHVRSVLLGLGAQLMMVMVSTFLRDPVAMRQFLMGYHEFWRTGFQQTSLLTEVEYEKAIALMSGQVRQRFETIRAALAGDPAAQLPDLLAGWLAHCEELRARVVELATSGRLELQTWDGAGPEDVSDPEVAVRRLLFPYLHMTNNRLQVTLGDEAYLSLVLARTLGEDGPDTDPSQTGVAVPVGAAATPSEQTRPAPE